MFLPQEKPKQAQNSEFRARFTNLEMKEATTLTTSVTTYITDSNHPLVQPHCLMAMAVNWVFN